jgi:hypothetical protein
LNGTVSEPPSGFKPPWLNHHLAENAPRRRLHLDPEIVPPPAGARPHIVAPMPIVLMVGCAAVNGLTMISAFQPDARWPPSFRNQKFSKRLVKYRTGESSEFDRLACEYRFNFLFDYQLAVEDLLCEAIGEPFETEPFHDTGCERKTGTS